MTVLETPAAVLRRRELAVLFRRCTWRQRKYLRAVIESDFQFFGPQAIKFGQSTIVRWLRIGHVRNAIEMLEQCALDDLRITARKILAEYSYIAFSDIGEVYDETGKVRPFKAMPRHRRAAIKEVSHNQHGPRVVLHDKMAALSALADFVKLSSKRVEVTGKDGEPLTAPPIINIVCYDDAAANTPAT